MAKGFRIMKPQSTRLEGDQWETVTSDVGGLLGFRAAGTNYTIFIFGESPFGVEFDIPQNECVRLADGLIVVPQSEAGENEQ